MDPARVLGGQGKKRWSAHRPELWRLLLTNYLSMHRRGSTEAIITGGFAADVPYRGGSYRGDVPDRLEKNRQYYERIRKDSETR